MTPGARKAGYCTLCASPAAEVFIKGARDGWNAKKAQTVGENYGLQFTRQLWYKHAAHAKGGELMVIQAAKAVQAAGAASIKKTSNKDFLEAVRDLGMQRALNNPDEVTVRDAIDAVKVLEARKDKRSDQLNILVQFTVGAPPPVQVIEGEAVEVSS